MSDRLVVIGGDAGGMSAAAQARRLRADLEIVVFERGSYTSYAACGLPYFVGDEVTDRDSLVARTPEQFREQGIDVRTRHEVVAIDTAARTVDVTDLDTGTTSTEPYGELLIATGATPILPPLPGIDGPGVFDIRTIPDADAIRSAIEDGARRAAVVGGGYIGVEVAEAFVTRGLEVTLLELADQPMPTLDADMAELVTKALVDLGITVRLGTAVTGFVSSDDSLSAVDTTDGPVPADLAVVGLGVRAELDPRGRRRHPHRSRRRDHRRRTPAHARRRRVGGRRTASSHGTGSPERAWSWRSAPTPTSKGGSPDPTSAAPRRPSAASSVPLITRVGAVEVARTGLTEKEASAHGLDAFAVTTKGLVRAHYFPVPTPSP
ncbi:MAG: FAD-dependent oxidoreductase [Microthrixaceae bacterium]